MPTLLNAALCTVLAVGASSTFLALWFNASLPNMCLAALQRLRLTPSPSQPFMDMTKSEVEAWLSAYTPGWLSELLGCPFCMSPHLMFWLSWPFVFAFGVAGLWYMPFVNAFCFSILSLRMGGFIKQK